MNLRTLPFLAALLAATIPARADVPPYVGVPNGFPPELAAGANVLDVTNLPAAVLATGVVNAVPDDGVDDTPAIRAAIRYALDDRASYDRNNSPYFIYFPNGTYVVGREIQSRIDDGTPNSWSDGWRRGMYFLGQSRAGTILRLPDNLPACQDPANPRAVIKTGSEGDSTDNEAGGGNRAFDHSIMNLTVDTGRGNPGAIGIDYLVNNTGTIEDVTIRSGDPSGTGVCGLDMRRNWPGPALVKNVDINGFDYGTRMLHYVYSMTFEHLTLRGQKVRGMTTSDNNVYVRALTSVNAVPVFESTGGGSLTLVDADLFGGLPTNPALILTAPSLLRNVTSTGYGTVVSNRVNDAGGNKAPDVPGGPAPVTVAEYSTHGIKKLWPTGTHTIGLPVKETPEYYSADPAKYLSVASPLLAHPATRFNANDDDAVGIQEAIDRAASLGAEIVYLPCGRYDIGSTIVLRGGVRKLMGCKSAIWNKPGFTGDALRFDGGAADSVVVEFINLIGGWAVHNGEGTLALRHLTLDRYTNTAAGTGDVFLEDVNGRQFLFDHPQNAWCRQLNPEFVSPAVRNVGGNLWILGLKSEAGTGITLVECTGGHTELMGSYYEPSHDTTDVPFIRLTDAEFTGNVSTGGDRHRILVEETRAGETRRLFHNGVDPASLTGSDQKVMWWKTVPLYVARTVDTPPPVSYALWSLTAFPANTPAADRAPAEDPNGDGVSNLLAYAFALDPLRTSTPFLPVFGVETTAGTPGERTLVLRYRRNRLADDLRYETQVSDDLLTWLVTSEPASIVATDPDGNGLAEWREVRVPVGVDETRKFLRLRVTKE